MPPKAQTTAALEQLSAGSGPNLNDLRSPLRRVWRVHERIANELKTSRETFVQPDGRRARLPEIRLVSPVSDSQGLAASSLVPCPAAFPFARLQSLRMVYFIYGLV